jgi:hypothetical protein
MGVIMEGRLDETRWLSYGELARAKAISKRAAIRLANRQGWQHRPDHRGPVRVAVPASALGGQPGRRGAAAPAPARESAEAAPGRTGPADARLRELTAELQTMRAQMTDLRLGKASARARAEAAEAEAARLRAVLEAGLLGRLRWLFSRSLRV